MQRNIVRNIRDAAIGQAINYGANAARRYFNGRNRRPANNNNFAEKPRVNNNNRRRRRRRQTGGISVMRGGGGAKQIGTVSAPIAKTGVIKRLPSGLDNMVFSHSELILTVYGSEDFQLVPIPVNPGLVTTFPWLSQLAALWDTYTTLVLNFRFVPGCASTTSGTVMIGFDYDAYDDPPANKASFMMLQDACTGPSWAECEINLKRMSLNRRKNLYMRSGGISSGDLKTYDLGNLFVATQGQSDESFIGEIYVDYSFRMSMPQQVAPPVETSFSIASTAGTLTAAKPFGAKTRAENVNIYELAASPPGFVNSDNTNSEYVFERTGSFLVYLTYNGTGFTQNGSDDCVLGNTQDFPDDTIDIYNVNVNSGATVYTAAYTINITEGNYLIIKIDGATTVTLSRLLILPIQGGLSSY
jgi:hypothetical protein